MNDGFITLDRKLLNWEWFHKSEMVHLFTFLLLKANYENGVFEGREVLRGQLITGLHSLNKHTGISTRSLRTCLNRLKSTGELTIESTSKYSVVTIVKYEEYQKSNKKSTSKSTSKSTNERQAIDKQSTTSKEVLLTEVQQVNNLLNNNEIPEIFKNVNSDDLMIFFKSNKSWQEKTCMSLKIDTEIFNLAQNEFIALKSSSLQEWNNISQAVSNFINWLNIQLKKNTKNGKQQTVKGIYADDGTFIKESDIDFSKLGKGR